MTDSREGHLKPNSDAFPIWISMPFELIFPTITSWIFPPQLTRILRFCELFLIKLKENWKNFVKPQWALVLCQRQPRFFFREINALCWNFLDLLLNKTDNYCRLKKSKKLEYFKNVYTSKDVLSMQMRWYLTHLGLLPDYVVFRKCLNNCFQLFRLVFLDVSWRQGFSMKGQSI